MRMFYNQDLDWNYEDSRFYIDVDLFWKEANRVARNLNERDRRLYENLKRRIRRAAKSGTYIIDNYFEEYILLRKVTNDAYGEYRTAYPFWGHGSPIWERVLGLGLTNQRNFIRENFKHWLPRTKREAVDVFLNIMDDYDLVEALFNKAWGIGDEDEED